MSQRTLPWGTILAGAIALGTAVLVGLIEVAGLNITLRGTGPGAVIAVGLLILIVGLVVVLRSGRAARRATGEAASPARQTTAPAPTAPSPAPSTPLDVSETVPTASSDTTPVATGPDGEPAQSSH